MGPTWKPRGFVRAEEGGAEGSPHPLLVRNAAALVTRILRVFGLSTAGPDELGFGGEAAKQAGGEQYLDALAAFRDDIRRLAKAKAPSSEIMSSCDRWALPSLGCLTIPFVAMECVRSVQCAVEVMGVLRWS